MAMASVLASSSALLPTRNDHGFVGLAARQPPAQFGLPLVSRCDRRCNEGGDCSSRSSGKQAFYFQNIKISKILSTVTAVGAATLLATTLMNVEAVDALEGVEVGALFQRSCAGCHTGGSNLLQPSATLFNKDLDRNGLNSVNDIYNITYFGKNRMPGYGEKCAPRGQCTFGPRLGEDEIRALAEFVKTQADQGWPSVKN